MKEVLRKLQLAWRDPAIRKKILITFLLIGIFRIFAFIPVSVIDTDRMRELFASNQFFALLDIFSGGTLVNFSIMALGLGPYITTSIITQLLTIIIPSFEELSKEGEYGKYKINQYTRMLAVPITILQSVAMYFLLKNQGILTQLSFFEFLGFVSTITAGTFIAMWFGELISEFGIGNGISLLIFVGIVARIPVVFAQSFSTSTGESTFTSALIVLLFVAVIAGVVFINESVRRIPVQYARRIRGNRMYQQAANYLPLKLNQAGVMPIIFAVSFVIFPQMIGNMLRQSPNSLLVSIGSGLMNIFNSTGYIYNIVYFFLVIAFTFFYTVLFFAPDKIAEQLQKQGGFIPGIRPGTSTVQYLRTMVYKITSAGALFLGIIAILPFIVSKMTGVSQIVVGGTGILIVVSVVLETFKLIEAQLVMKSYDNLQR
ncbi:MAG: Protein translocase subunit SecY [Microgenomates bacterium OLB22]|nr:MAG: Protein translocase subunit SecY [Microgenomates bacterium OLB22]